jgi:hypothetical protein
MSFQTREFITKNHCATISITTIMSLKRQIVSVGK